MEAEALLRQVTGYCRRAGLAETTFGRLAVNDGKFVSRLRAGGRTTPDTVARVRAFIARLDPAAEAGPPERDEPAPPATPPAPPVAVSATGAFRFYENRQKYLMFVNTCSEKLEVARRVIQEVPNLHPTPPAIRLFDAGVGDGTVLARVMRTLHHQFEKTPFYVVGKEISLEDVRLALEKMADRFQEHPATVLVMTNMHYAEAPWLTPASVAAASSLVWHELVLQGDSAAEFDLQISELEPFLNDAWRARISPSSGNPVYEKPAALVIYREDCRFLLDQVIPRRGAVRADYDLVIASQPYRARASTAFKAKRVVAPLTRALAPGGRLVGIHSCGGDPGMEIVRKVWPGEDPFLTNRHDLLRATKAELGQRARWYNFGAASDAKSLFKHHMHLLPSEIDQAGAVGTSTLFAAWNAATYNAQIEDHRLAEAMGGDTYLRATEEVLKAHGGLWFWDESFVISRKRDI
jgi:SAM-dependent methyltransferase